MSEKIYRQVEPSDLPKIQSGKLKVFYVTRNLAKTIATPARLVSTRFGEYKTVMWIVENPDCDRYATTYNSMMIDITPEKRYTIWSKTYQRFVDNHQYPPSNNREAQQFLIDRWVQNGADPKKYAIVEFDYPGE